MKQYYLIKKVFCIVSGIVGLSFLAQVSFADEDVDRRLILAFKQGADPSQLALPRGVVMEPSKCHSLLEEKGVNVHPCRYPYTLLCIDRESAQQLLKQLEKNPSIDYVEFDGMGQGSMITVPPNDPDFNRQWHHQLISSQAAWGVTTGSNQVTLAIVDSGINLTLPDFNGRLVAGRDFVNNDDDPTDDHGHGSAVAAIAAGTGNNSADTVGIDWGCRIMPIKVLDNNNRGSFANWAAGIDFAVANGADVINLSANGDAGLQSQALTRAIRNAVQAGAVFVTTSGNNSAAVRFPGTIEEAIVVGSTTSTNTLSPFSNFGPTIDLVAPGGINNNGNFTTNITTTNLNGDTRWFFGTSFAAPQVAGAACLILSRRPNLNPAQVGMILRNSADDQLGDMRDTVGFDNFFGAGRLNVAEAIRLTDNLLPLVGSVVAFKGNNNKYVSSENGFRAMNCNRPAAGAWEKFIVIDAGGGKLAFLGNNNKFVSSEDGRASMNCNRSALGGWEKFAVAPAGDSKFMLRGNNNRFVSSENGAGSINCNRIGPGSWERFSWEIVR